MPKNYKDSESKPMIAAEPAVAYQRTKPTAKAVDWNPNRPVHATQEEWWDHIHQIEQGKFSTWEEHEKRFNVWKKDFLTNQKPHVPQHHSRLTSDYLSDYK